MLQRLAIMAAAAVMAACAASSQKVSAPAAGTPAPPPAPMLRSGLDLAGFDRSVRAQDDLYRFANGQWLANTPIPADRSSYGSFAILEDQAQEDVRQLIVAASEAPNRAPGSDAQKVGDYYRAYMDAGRVESLGLAPLQAELARIGAIATRRDVARYIGVSQTLGAPQPFSYFTSPDKKNSSIYIGTLAQRGLTMPDRDYYLSTDVKYAQFRAKFAVYAEQLLALGGERDPKSAAARIVALETRLAGEQWTRVQSRDPVKAYNPMDPTDYQQLAPGFDWAAFFAGMNAPMQKLDLRQPSFIKAVGQLVRSVPVADWRMYFEFHLLDRFAPTLPRAFADLHFGFHEHTLNGVDEPKPRWRRAVDAMDGDVGELVGHLFVDAHFSPASKQKMLVLVHNVLVAFDASIDGLEWMSPQTRAEAKQKLAKITVKIGYPDVWRDYSAYTVRPDDLVGNLMRGAAFQLDRDIRRAGKPVDRHEWLMTPQTVNASYNLSTNEITFPAALLRPPLFDPAADDAVNYGGIGSGIGHEVSHAFDDQGRQYDGDGNLRDWWTAADAANFKARAAVVVSQFDGYSVLDNRHLNGALTLGENIGDLSGLAIAFRAYQIAKGGRASPVIDGFTGDQRFFLGFAQVWRREYRDAELLRRTLTDAHSPSEFRTNGPAGNIDAFYDAFGVRAGDRMYRPPGARARIW